MMSRSALRRARRASLAVPLAAAVPLFVAVAVLSVAHGAEAQRRLPVPEWVRSVEVTATGATVRAGASTASARRGTVQLGTRLPMIARVMGDGCPGGEWIQVGAGAFVCETLVRFSRSEAGGDTLPRVPQGSLTPRTHAFVATDGAWAYARPDDYFRDRWVESLGRGFGLAIVERRAVSGVEMARTVTGLWVLVSELRFARPSDFAGVEIAEGASVEDHAWIVRDRATLRAAPSGRVVERASRLMRVEIVATRGDWLELAGGRFVHRRDVARPRPATPPGEVSEGARWVDVDTSTQTLVAYVGTRPIFATAISSGRATSPTPRGTHRIWVKLAEDDMDDLDRDDVVENYAIQAVPWVQYFDGGNGFHAAFWHDRFGTARSHGCVNLSPSDARWLFEFTQPNLPPGWDAIVPGTGGSGTVVQVR